MNKNQIHNRLLKLENKLKPKMRIIVIVSEPNETVEEARKRVLGELGIREDEIRPEDIVIDANTFDDEKYKPKQN